MSSAVSRRNVLRATSATSAVAILSYSLTSTVAAQTPTFPVPPAADPRDAVQSLDDIEIVARFFGPMPTGVTVSQGGRIFVNFPRWEDEVDATVTELVNGEAVPFPNAEINRLDLQRPRETFVSVQSVVVDPRDRLWVLDTGSLNFGPVVPGGPKLVAIDLGTNQVLRTIPFSPQVALPTTSLNDVRFDLRRGRDGYAFITDASTQGPNAIIVVDLATGESVRRLNDHPTTKAEPGFVPIVEGRALMERLPGLPPMNLALGADGIAIGADGQRLFYSPLASRRLYSVSVDALVDRSQSDAGVAQTVLDHGEKGASDGLESDAEGRVYLTDYEHNALRRRLPSGMYETLYFDPNGALWPDTLSLAGDGYLYFTSNQLHRLARFNDGQDVRWRPFLLSRIAVDGTPVRLI
ncbi:MAG: major royal jelly family protein [Chloroflexota bacterium]|nr:major royal jelly family protein [Chloroflexota bacterium]